MTWMPRINLLRLDSRRSSRRTPSSTCNHSRDCSDAEDEKSSYSGLSRPTSPSNFSLSSGGNPTRLHGGSASTYYGVFSANSLVENLPFADAVDPRFYRGIRTAAPTDDDFEVAQRQQTSNLARIGQLQNSLENPNLSSNVRRVLEAALHQFERTEQLDKELLPPYTEDVRPPYTE
ncbi:CIC11C00000005242 [Sungouiella intermedia]|uniref:CIC11C00000005242 n=1 Tax=Sungouiella intermedia TaxID=45354 RepID=A0A1L0DFS3_9ASCO|nr:CIC11C00000005242 [[Candida] intermedia]